jgi:hypothetical protein
LERGGDYLREGGEMLGEVGMGKRKENVCKCEGKSYER